MPPSNSFAVDYQGGERVMDINNPPPSRYRHQEFPRMVYNATGHVMRVNDDKQLKAAEKKGFSMKPFPDFDYSRVGKVVLNPETDEFAAGVAETKTKVSLEDRPMTAAELAE